MSSAKSKKALIQWLGGEDDGKFAIVDIGWIKNFDYNEWKITSPSRRNESEVVEWKVGRKPESGFYPCYDGKVLSVSSKVATLNAQKADAEKAAMDAEQAAKTTENGGVKKKKAGESSNSQVDIEDKSAKKKAKINAEKTDNDNKNGKGDQAAEDETDSEGEGNKASANSKRKPSKLAIDSSEEDNPESSDEEVPLSSKKAKLQEKNKADTHTFQRLEEKGKKLLKKDTSRKESSSSGQVSESSPKVPIYKGSPYYVDLPTYEHSKQLSCATFVNAMLHQLFKSEILVVSNLRGGKSKSNPANDFQRWALDPKKRKAIVTAATSLFPRKSKSTIHGYITAHINSLRFKLRKKGKLEKYESRGKNKMSGKPHTVDSASSSDSE